MGTQRDGEYQLVLLIYLLQLLAVLFGVTAIIAILLNHSKQHQVQQQRLGRHFRWQIWTFWPAAALLGAALIFSALSISSALYVAAAWYYVRCIFGLWSLHNNTW